MVNGSIYNNQLPQEPVNNLNAYALEPLPPSTYLAISYQNAYQTAFEAEGNAIPPRYLQQLIYNPPVEFLPSLFINGTFGYTEQYKSYSAINYLIEDSSNYQSQPYLYVSAGSGGGSGYMYLDWVIATFGVPYELIIS